MLTHSHSSTDCLLVGDYLDECDSPPIHSTSGEVVRPQTGLNFVADWGHDEGTREFTVLLKDGRVVAVRGHTLKHEPHPVAGEDVYSVIVRIRSDEVIAALFKSADVAGIFHGSL